MIGGHGGVGGGGYTADDADGLGHLHDADVVQIADDTPGLHTLELIPDDLGLGLVLDDLVLVFAHTGLVHGHSGQHLAVVIDDLSNAPYGLVHLLLGVGLKFLLGCPGPVDQALNVFLGIHALCFLSIA